MRIRMRDVKEKTPTPRKKDTLDWLPKEITLDGSEELPEEISLKDAVYNDLFAKESE